MILDKDGVWRQFQGMDCDEEFEDPNKAPLVVILRLHPDRACDLFDVSVEDAKPDHRLACEALSYSWGPSIIPNTYIHRQAVGTPKDRVISLPHLHNLGLPRDVWVDAICIDRSNLGERERKTSDFLFHQVDNSDIRNYIQSQFWSETLRLSKKREKARGTCEWLFTNDKFVKWKNTTDKPLLWLAGSAGAGKSTICSAIIDILEADRHVGDIVTSYFINGRTTASNTVFNILRTMAAEMLLRARSLEYVDGLKALMMDLDAAGVHMSLSRIREFLLRIRNYINSGETMCLVLDGWDDLAESQRVSYLLREILNVVNGKDGSSQSMKFLISSRSDIPHGKNYRGALVMDIDTEICVHNDVATYLQYEMSRLKLSDIPQGKDFAMTVKTCAWGAVPPPSATSSFFKPVPAGHQKFASLPSATFHNWDEAYLRIKYGIIDKGEANFLWARLLVENLRATNQSIRTTHKLIEKLISRDCSGLYQDMIHRISEKDRYLALQMFRWVIYAARPLNSWELLDAIYTQTGMQLVETDIQKICAGLLRVNEDGMISLFHLGLRDHIQTQTCKDDILGWVFVSSSSDEMIAHTCLQTLSPELLLESLGCAMARSSPTYTQNLQSYAFNYWKLHYKFAERQSIYLAGMLQERLKWGWEHRDIHKKRQDGGVRMNLEESPSAEENEIMKIGTRKS
jgi:hypothetical protein